jgi:hypothetical protein
VGTRRCAARADRRSCGSVVDQWDALREAPADRSSYVRDSLELLMGALVGGGEQATV